MQSEHEGFINRWASLTHPRRIALVASAALLAAAAHAQSDPQSAALVAAKLRKAFPGMPATATVEATVVPGIYAMRAPGFSGCTPYVDADVTMIANNGTRGWAYVKTGQPISTQDSSQLATRIYQSIPADLPIMNAGGTDRGAILISGVDCQPSAEAEKQLSKNKISYRLLPTAISPANWSEATKAACATDPVKAWTGSRANGGRVQATAQAACRFDAVAAKDISCMFMGGRSPTALFPDGRFSQTSDDVVGLMTKR